MYPEFVVGLTFSGIIGEYGEAGDLVSGAIHQAWSVGSDVGAVDAVDVEAQRALCMQGRWTGGRRREKLSDLRRRETAFWENWHARFTFKQSIDTTEGLCVNELNGNVAYLSFFLKSLHIS